MKTRKILFVLILFAGLMSCTKETEIVDPIYEFVSFIGIPDVNLNEANNSTEGFPLVIQLWAFNPYTEDIDLTLEVTGTNAQPGVDFVNPSATLKIPKGKLTSDTLWIKTIDNLSSTDLERKFEVKIKSASISDLKIGLGLNEHRNQSVVFTILDDECSLTTAIYDSDNLTTTIDYGSGDVLKPATGEIVGDQFTVVGNLIDYADYTLIMTLTPNGPGETKGTATFGDYYAGFASDGYEYRFVQVGEGTYDVCSGTVDVEYDIYYVDGGWVYWYSVTNTYSAQ